MEKGKQGASKLTKERVLVIKSLFQFSDITDTDIAVIFNVSRSMINTIRHGHRWKEINNSNEEGKNLWEIIESSEKNWTTTNKVRSNDYRDFTTKEDEIKQNMKEAMMTFITQF